MSKSRLNSSTTRQPKAEVVAGRGRTPTLEVPAHPGRQSSDGLRTLRSAAAGVPIMVQMSIYFQEMQADRYHAVERESLNKFSKTRNPRSRRATKDEMTVTLLVSGRVVQT